MMIEEKFEDPSASRIHVSSMGGETNIVVPAIRQPFVMIFLIVWLGGWTAGGVSALKSFTDATGPSEGRAFLGFWLWAWLLGELFMLGSLLWMLCGKELIKASLTSLSHTYRMLFWSRTRRHQPVSATNLRWEAGSPSPYSDYFRQWSVSFEYGPRMVSMAKGCDAGEAAFIISAIVRGLGRKVAGRSAVGSSEQE